MSVAALAGAVAAAQRLAVLTGAGISAESGIPTFREAQTGLWAQFSAEELATPEAFARAPDRVWQWYEWRRSLVRAASPNAGHHALVELESLIPDFTLITQNVDGLHTRAGSRNVIELHGSIERTKCSKENNIVHLWPETDQVPPRCPRCGAPLRPDVVWFGEMLPERALRNAAAAAERCTVMLVVGTSGLVHPAAGLPEHALRAGAIVGIINPEIVPLSTAAGVIHLRGTAATLLPELVEGVRNARARVSQSV
jgi:NAD-dependent deacetylase